MRKQFKFIIIAIGAMAAMSACNRFKTTQIVNSTDNYRQEIKYAGKVVFNNDSTDIAHISSGGYLFFDDNGKKLRAENDGHDKVQYSFNGDGYVNRLTTEQRDFVASAVKAIIRERAKLRR